MLIKQAPLAKPNSQKERLWYLSPHLNEFVVPQRRRELKCGRREGRR
jgi:hypothetical protein